MRALATWSVRHRRLVVLIWLVAFVAVTFIAHGVGSNYTNSFSLPHTESTEALDLLESVSPNVSGDVERVVFASTRGGGIHDPAVESRVSSMLAKVEKLPSATGVISPYNSATLGGEQVSKDGRVAFATVTFDKQPQNIPDSEAKALVRIAKSADAPGLTVVVSGQLAEQAAPQSVGGTGLGVLLALIVLLLVFGSIFAAALPLVSALASLGTAIGIIGLLSHLMKMPQFSTELVLLIGLGVGVDYALFIVTRHRQGLIAGADTESSIVNAINTSGRAVVFAGIIVCIALLGMFALGITFLYGMAIAASIGVALTMLAAITLLPALLGFIGPRVLSRRQKRELAEKGPRIVGAGTKGFWPKWADLVSRRPALPAILALALIVLISLPFFSLRLGASDQGNDPKGSTTRQAYDLLAKGFGPGFNGPLQLVAVNHGPLDKPVLARLVTAVEHEPDVASVATPMVIAGKHDTSVALVNVFPSTAPQAKQTTDLIATLREHTIPKLVSGSGMRVYVGGMTAIFVDFSNVLSQKLPLFVGVVVLLSVLLLAIVFRSIAIPITAAIMNLLSIGAAFGILVAVFEHGVLGGLFGVTRVGPVEPFLPVMLFAILFGLSMDYEVFLVSRIHEEWRKTGDNRTAVRNGLAATGKTITAAALIMILVFGSFILGGERVIREFGLGLAAGILIDAVVIRMAIVPAVMLLLGKANWWFPRRLDRVLPRLSVDPETVLTLAVAGDGAAKADAAGADDDAGELLPSGSELADELESLRDPDAEPEPEGQPA
jgi:RND superfamily putative drug exporter